MFMNHYNKNLEKSSLSLSIGLALALSLSACQPNDNNPSATDNQQTDNSTQANSADTDADTNTSTSIATQIEFPQYIKGFPTLLHPISPLSLTAEQDDSISSMKSRDQRQPNAFAETQPYTYQTYVSNIVFEDLTTGFERKLLADDRFIIRSIFIPHITKKRVLRMNLNADAVTDFGDDTADDNVVDDAIVDTVIVDNSIVTNIEPDNNTNDPDRRQPIETINTLFKHAIYHISETPYQKDAKDKNILKQQALYMSNDKGNQLIKLHPNNEYVQEIKWLPQLSRYYFITQSDSDDNGIIDDKDDTHNYQIDFSKDLPVVKNYDFEK